MPDPSMNPAMMAAAGGPGAAGTPPSPSVPPGPQAAPMAQPSPNRGNAQMGKAQVESAMQILEQAIAQLGSSSKEGAAVIRALNTLATHFNRQEGNELVPSQIMQMASAAKPSPLAAMLAQHGGGGSPSPMPPQ